jgi:hypothetical protein
MEYDQTERVTENEVNAQASLGLEWFAQSRSIQIFHYWNGLLAINYFDTGTWTIQKAIPSFLWNKADHVSPGLLHLLSEHKQSASTFPRR